MLWWRSHLGEVSSRRSRILSDLRVVDLVWSGSGISLITDCAEEKDFSKKLNTFERIRSEQGWLRMRRIGRLFGSPRTLEAGFDPLGEHALPEAL